MEQPGTRLFLTWEKKNIWKGVVCNYSADSGAKSCKVVYKI